MNTHASPDNRARGRGVLATVLVVTTLLLAACSAKSDTKADAGPSAAPSPIASVSAPGSTSPGAATPAAGAGNPSSHGATSKPTTQPTVKVIVHYTVAATHVCSWKVGSDGNLAISVGFKITATGKNPPAEIPFEITDGQAKMSGYEPVGDPFQAVLDSGKPLAGNSWVGKVVTTKVTVNSGQSNVARTSVTLDGPVKGVASGDTYCPAD